MGPNRPIQRSWKVSVRKRVIWPVECGGAPSIWNHGFSIFKTSSCGIMSLRSSSKNLAVFRLPSIKNGPIMAPSTILVQSLTLLLYWVCVKFWTCSFVRDQYLWEFEKKDKGKGEKGVSYKPIILRIDCHLKKLWLICENYLV